MMRPANQNFKMRPIHLEEHVRESDHILHQIGQMKETVSPYLSNTKISDGQRQKWFQYLPNQNAYSNNYGSVSREQNRNDNYLHSLERRLEKLFREEKEMLKERHHKNQQNQSQYDARYKRSITSQQISVPILPTQQHKPFEASNQIEIMDRKIRELEERYRKQDFSQKHKEKSPVKQSQVLQRSQKKKTQKESTEQQNVKYTIDKMSYDYSPTYKQDVLTQSVEECMNKQKYLQEQVESLKKSVRELHQNNKSLLKRIENRQQKRKHKQRTKQLLKEIIHKLEFINIQIGSAKKRDSKQTDGKIGKLQRETNQICQEFERLRLLYKHLQDEKTNFQKKQKEFEKKIEQLSAKKNQDKL